MSKNPRNPRPPLSTPSHLLAPPAAASGSAPSASVPFKAPPPPRGAEEEETLRVVLEALLLLVRGGLSLEGASSSWSARQGLQGSQARNSPGM